MTFVTGARRNFLRLAWRSEARVANECAKPDFVLTAYVLRSGTAIATSRAGLQPCAAQPNRRRIHGGSCWLGIDHRTNYPVVVRF